MTNTQDRHTKIAQIEETNNQTYKTNTPQWISSSKQTPS